MPGTHRYQDPRDLSRVDSGQEHHDLALKVPETSPIGHKVADREQLKW